MPEALEQFYSHYSSIVTIRILDKHLNTIGYGYAVVELEDGRFADAYILLRADTIRYCIFSDEPYPKDWFEYRDTQNIFGWMETRWKSLNARKRELEDNVAPCLRSPPDQSAPLNILNALNDKCFVNVFTHLSLADLCSVADTCIRFKMNAIQSYSLKFADAMPDVYDLCGFESLFRNFGNKIKALSLNAGKKIHPQTLNVYPLILNTYYSGGDGQLQKLELSHCHFENFWFERLRPIFVNLKHLSLERYPNIDVVEYCENLTTLNLWNIQVENIPNETIMKQIAKLETLTFYGCQIPKHFFDAMEMSETLKILKVNYVPEIPSVQTVCLKFPVLEELSLQSDFVERWKYQPVSTVIDGNLKASLMRMKNLKTLQLNGRMIDLGDFIQSI